MRLELTTDGNYHFQGQRFLCSDFVFNHLNRDLPMEIEFRIEKEPFDGSVAVQIRIGNFVDWMIGDGGWRATWPKMEEVLRKMLDDGYSMVYVGVCKTHS